MSESETWDRIITGTLSVAAGVAGSVEAPVLAPVAIIVAIIGLLLSFFAPEDLLRIVKWVLIFIVVVLVLILLSVVGIGYLLLHALHIA